jgi:hypothetical protein
MQENVFWNVFEDTGSIEAYLLYKGERDNLSSENMGGIKVGIGSRAHNTSDGRRGERTYY